MESPTETAETEIERTDITQNATLHQDKKHPKATKEHSKTHKLLRGNVGLQPAHQPLIEN